MLDLVVVLLEGSAILIVLDAMQLIARQDSIIIG